MTAIYMTKCGHFLLCFKILGGACRTLRLAWCSVRPAGSASAERSRGGKCNQANFYPIYFFHRLIIFLSVCFRRRRQHYPLTEPSNGLI